MDKKRCSNCEKWMIEWKDNTILCSIPPQVRFDFKCACGHTEFSRFSQIDGLYDPSFDKEWEKANEDK